MVKLVVKNISFISGMPTDITDDMVDIMVILEDNSSYMFEVTTPQALANYMIIHKQKFVDPDYPAIIVSELTETVIKEAIQAFINELDDGFWFKLYSSTLYFTTDDLDLIIDRHNKEEEN